MFDELGLRK